MGPQINHTDSNCNTILKQRERELDWSAFGRSEKNNSEACADYNEARQPWKKIEHQESNLKSRKDALHKRELAYQNRKVDSERLEKDNSMPEDFQVKLESDAGPNILEMALFKAK